MSHPHAAQLGKDLDDRIRDLKNTAYMAEKQRMRPEAQANTFGGDFSGLSDNMKLCDVDEYIEFLVNFRKVL